MTVKPKHKQTILDVAIEHTGSVEGFIQIMVNNSISSLNHSGELELANIPVVSSRVVKFFTLNDCPATAPKPQPKKGSFNKSFNKSFN